MSSVRAFVAARKVIFTILAFGGVAESTLATNGLNLIGFGAESIGMGGADVAVARDTSALNVNPAGLSQIVTRRFDSTVGAAFALNVRHKDPLGNDVATENSPIPGANFGYAHRLGAVPMTLGIGSFVQGGAGFEYSNLATAFGTRDDLKSTLGILQLTPGLGYQVTDDFSLGLTLLGTYAMIDQEVFPNTSFRDPADASRTFFGSSLDDMSAIGFAVKLGALYRANEWLKLGIAYTTEADLDFDGGELVSNMNAVGMGRVTYRDVTLQGLGTPRELVLGVAIQPTARLLIALDLSWLNWANAVSDTTLIARNPDNPSAPPELIVSSRPNWRDQFVVAVGGAYEVTANGAIRLGYNYGRDPTHPATLDPLLASISEHHFTAGAGYRFSAHWRVDGAVEYRVNKKVIYTNPDLPFGPDAAAQNESVAIFATISRIW
ncbi:MAG: outer membrane protein transport protein [Gammaproteobacteria bacterium]